MTTIYRNSATTLDELIELLQRARAAHGNCRVVAKDDTGIGKRVSLQSTIVRNEPWGGEYEWRNAAGHAQLSHGWNFDISAADYDRPHSDYNPLEQTRKFAPDAEVGILIF